MIRTVLLAALLLAACGEDEEPQGSACCPKSPSLDLYIEQIKMTNPSARPCEQASKGNPFGLNEMTFAEVKWACTMCSCEPYSPAYGQALSLPDAGQ